MNVVRFIDSHLPLVPAKQTDAHRGHDQDPSLPGQESPEGTLTGTAPLHLGVVEDVMKFSLSRTS